MCQICPVRHGLSPGPFIAFLAAGHGEHPLDAAHVTGSQGQQVADTLTGLPSRATPFGDCVDGLEPSRTLGHPDAPCSKLRPGMHKGQVFTDAQTLRGQLVAPKH